MYKMSTLSFNNNLYREILSPLDQFEIRDLLSLDAPAVLSGKLNTMWVKLPNSGDALKLLVLSHIWKYMSGWTNYSGIVTSQKMIEKEMGYRGSKSNKGNTLFVKEQRVDGSYIGANSSMLRCTLKGFERNYQIKIPSYQLFTKRQYSTNNLSKGLIPPFFITGFTDGEGSFMVTMLKYPALRLGWKVQAWYVLTSHKKDLSLIKNIQSSLGGIGNIHSKSNKDLIQLRVVSLDQITNVIIPHFEKYPLYTQKKADFELFKCAVNIMNTKGHLTLDGLQEIFNIKASMNKGLSGMSSELKQAFNIVNIPRPIIEVSEIKDPNWLSGFTSAEGCFHIKQRMGKKGNKIVELIFSISQHSRDKNLIESLVGYLGCGRFSVSKEAAYYTCSRFTDIIEKILPFFNNYPILGVKSDDLKDLCKVCEIVKSKGHLTDEGFNQIAEIKKGMNFGRLPK